MLSKKSVYERPTGRNEANNKVPNHPYLESIFSMLVVFEMLFFAPTKKLF